MKRLMLVCVMILTLALSSFLGAQADGPLPLRVFVEQVLAPMALANDYDWRIVQEFSNDELGALIDACEANGILLPEDGYVLRRYRNGESCSEESAISEVCEVFWGDNFWQWRIADRQWLRDVMAGIGYDDWEREEVPGPDDLPEDEARSILFAALHAEFGDDIPFEDPARFSAYFVFEPWEEYDEDSWAWEMECWGNGHRYIARMDRAGQNAYAFEYIERPYARAATPPEAYSLTREEAIRLAAEAIRSETGIDAPLEDPEVYSANAQPLTAASDGLLYWEVMFSSRSKDWGYCMATVEDGSRVVRIKTADVGPITPDNALRRWQNKHGFWGSWTLEIWVQLTEEIAGLPAETPEGRTLAGTKYILPTDDLLPLLRADEIAFRAAGLTRADIYCLVLIDADPHPVWKFCLETVNGTYVQGYTTVEIDAVTGEMLDLATWEYDVDPDYCVYSLHSSWAELMQEE